MNDDHDAPRGARTMNLVRWGLLIGVALVAVVSLVSFFVSRASDPSTIEQAEALYHCPMHPTYTSDREGECPICGMDFERIAVASSDGADGRGDVPGLTTVHIEPERLQLIGVRTTVVERAPLSTGLELVGFVAPDEARIKRVQLRTSGWIQALHVNRTGDVVRKGQPLLGIYSPQLYQSELEFLIELDAQGDVHHGGSGLAPSRDRLRLLGVPDDEIERLEREREAATQITLKSPVAGTVLERNVVEGQHVGAETSLFTIADLSQVWVLADLYEIDFAKAKVGDRAVFEADALPGAPIEGRVDFIYPTVSNETRTLKARIVMNNRNGNLRPGMYGRVRISSRSVDALSVPLEAVVNTGEQHYVFVVGEPGHFEPRSVTVGMRDRDRVQIVHGLSEGETVVASATFLIDSESRLKAAIDGMQAPDGHDHGTAP